MSVNRERAETGLRGWHLVGITLAVSGIGLVGGAAWAAPDQLLPVARLAGASIAERSGMISTDAKELVTSLGGAQGALNLMLGDRSPRRLGMLIAALIGATFGLAAARNWWLSRRRAVRPVRLPRTASSPMPAEPTRRRGSRSGVLQRVHALAAKGSTSMEIARDTGLPSDAVALLLAMTEGQQQRPRTAA